MDNVIHKNNGFSVYIKGKIGAGNLRGIRNRLDIVPVKTDINGSDGNFLPFDGKIDFDRVAKQLKNWDGILMLEVSGNIERYAAMDKDEYLEKAVGTIKRLREMVEAE